MYLNATDGQSSASATWNSTTPTSTVWSVGNDQNNTSGYTILTYAFTSIKGFSRVGVYRGNGNNNGAFIYTGFQPNFVIIKSITAGRQWQIRDGQRGFNGAIKTLYSDSSEVETSGDTFDILSNGFKPRNTSNVQNTDGETYIYMAYAENPFVASNGDPTTAR